MTLIGDVLTDVVAVLTSSVAELDNVPAIKRGFIDKKVTARDLPCVWVFPDRSRTGQAMTAKTGGDFVLVGCVARGGDDLDKMLELEQACINGLSLPQFRQAFNSQGLKVEAVGASEYIPPEVHQDGLSFIFSFSVSVVNLRRRGERG